jgi:hypothetical protein
MLGDQHTSYSLIFAVREGRLQRVRELISSFGLSYKHGQKIMFYFVKLLSINIQRLLNCF